MKSKIIISALCGLLTAFLPIWTECGPTQYLTIAGGTAFFAWEYLTDFFGFQGAREKD